MPGIGTLKEVSWIFALVQHDKSKVSHLHLDLSEEQFILEGLPRCPTLYFGHLYMKKHHTRVLGQLCGYLVLRCQQHSCP